MSKVVLQESKKAWYNVEDLNIRDKWEIIKISIQSAKSFMGKYISYEAIREELSTYDVALPELIDSSDISQMTVLYAKAQAYHSRISTIEMLAIENASNWKKVNNYMDSYLQDLESKLWISEEVKELSNQKIQAAFVRSKLENLRNKYDEYVNELEQAITFKTLIAVKKKDIVSILENLTRQVKVVKDDKKSY